MNPPQQIHPPVLAPAFLGRCHKITRLFTPLQLVYIILGRGGPCAWNYYQGIDVDIFLQLNENNAKEILKDFVLGIKLKFWRKYAEWKDTVKFEEMSVKSFTGGIFSSTKNINNKMEEREKLTEVNQSETSISSEEVVELEHVSGDSDNNDLESGSENNKLPNKMGMKRRQNLAETENLTSTKKKKMVNPNIVAEKRIIAFSVSHE